MSKLEKLSKRLNEHSLHTADNRDELVELYNSKIEVTSSQHDVFYHAGSTVTIIIIVIIIIIIII